MIAKPSSIPIKNITCPTVSQHHFDEAKLTTAARLILSGRGIINPLVLQLQDLDQYTVESGFFEYYAALRAYQIDPINGANIDAYIMDATNEVVIKLQIEMFREPWFYEDMLAKLSVVEKIEAIFQRHGGLEKVIDICNNIEEIETRLASIEKHPAVNQRGQV